MLESDCKYCICHLLIFFFSSSFTLYTSFAGRVAGLLHARGLHRRAPALLPGRPIRYAAGCKLYGVARLVQLAGEHRSKAAASCLKHQRAPPTTLPWCWVCCSFRLCAHRSSPQRVKKVVLFCIRSVVLSGCFSLCCLRVHE